MKKILKEGWFVTELRKFVLDNLNSEHKSELRIHIGDNVISYYRAVLLVEEFDDICKVINNYDQHIAELTDYNRLLRKENEELREKGE